MNYPKRGERTEKHKKTMSKAAASKAMGEHMTKKVAKTQQMKEQKNKTAKYR